MPVAPFEGAARAGEEPGAAMTVVKFHTDDQLPVPTALVAFTRQKQVVLLARPEAESETAVRPA